jgi:hypothetical protein
MQATKLEEPPEPEDAAADVAADAELLDELLLDPPPLLLPQAVSASTAADRAATTAMLCVRRKTLTSLDVVRPTIVMGRRCCGLP